MIMIYFLFLFFKYCANVENCESFRSFGFRVSLFVKFGLNKNNFVLKNENDEFEFKLDLLER